MPSVFVALILAIVFAALATLFAIISASTDYWEVIDWNMDALKSHNTVVVSNSTFSETNGYYEVVTQLGDNSSNATTSYLRSTYGGIWRICDKVSGNDLDIVLTIAIIFSKGWKLFHVRGVDLNPR